jgi:hypothetical protein
MPREEPFRPLPGTAQRWRPIMAARSGRLDDGEVQPASAAQAAVRHAAVSAMNGHRPSGAAVGVVRVLDAHSLTVHVRRGGPPSGGDRLVTYRIAGSATRVYKGGRRTTLDDIAVGDLVLVHAHAPAPGEWTGGARPGEPHRLTAARVHGLTPSRPGEHARTRQPS